MASPSRAPRRAHCHRPRTPRRPPSVGLDPAEPSTAATLQQPKRPSTDLTLAWTHPVSGLPSSGYRLAYAPAGGAWRSTNLGVRTSWTLTGLKNGTKYYVYLYAMNSAGSSPAATTTATLPNGTPRNYRVTARRQWPCVVGVDCACVGDPNEWLSAQLRRGRRIMAQHQSRNANELHAHRTEQRHEVLRVPRTPSAAAASPLPPRRRRPLLALRRLRQLRRHAQRRFGAGGTYRVGIRRPCGFVPSIREQRPHHVVLLGAAQRVLWQLR